MSIIQPGLFLILRRFPRHKNDLRQLYRTSDSFQAMCHNYQKCSEALNYWSASEHEQAPLRKQEYAELIMELEQEIIQTAEEGC